MRKIIKLKYWRHTDEGLLLGVNVVGLDDGTDDGLLLGRIDGAFEGLDVHLSSHAALHFSRT